MTRRRAKQKESRGAARLSPKPRDSQRFPKSHFTTVEPHPPELEPCDDFQGAVLREVDYLEALDEMDEATGGER